MGRTNQTANELTSMIQSTAKREHSSRFLKNYRNITANSYVESYHFSGYSVVGNDGVNTIQATKACRLQFATARTPDDMSYHQNWKLAGHSIDIRKLFRLLLPIVGHVRVFSQQNFTGKTSGPGCFCIKNALAFIY